MAASPITITFLSADMANPLQQRKLMKTVLQYLLKNQTPQYKSGNVNVVFCSDEYLLQLNQNYLQHDTLTDIITFSYGEGDELLSDIFISVPRVKENALSFKQYFQQELRRVIFHGFLHLAGFKDKNLKETQMMRIMEEKYLSVYNNL